MSELVSKREMSVEDIKRSVLSNETYGANEMHNEISVYCW